MRSIEEVSKKTRCFTSLTIVPSTGDPVEIRLNDSEGVESSTYIQNAIDFGVNDLAFFLLNLNSDSKEAISYTSIVWGTFQRSYLNLEELGTFYCDIDYTLFGEKDLKSDTSPVNLHSSDVKAIIGTATKYFMENPTR